MLDDVLPLLRCPHDARPLARDGGVVRCAQGHAYDVARQGHLSLLTGGAGPGTGDTAAMVAARERFLSAGHYDAVGDALAGLAAPGPALDVGAGTGHHLSRLLDRTGDVGIALDLSAYAARRAARRPRTGAVVADAWRGLPVADGAVGSVLSVFAPRAPEEARRVLAPGGRLVVATPTPRHLVELVGPLGLVSVDARKDERLAAQLSGWRLAGQTLVETRLALAAAGVRDLVGMGPSAHHVDVDALPVADAEVTLSVRVAAYEP